MHKKVKSSVPANAQLMKNQYQSTMTTGSEAKSSATNVSMSRH